MNEKEIEKFITDRLKKSVADCSDSEIYSALTALAGELADKRKSEQNFQKPKKKLYYISAEFLIGRLLGNNLINLGIYEQVENLLSSNGKNLGDIEQLENEPSLGNGGLGRLASCFLDSVANLGLCGDGVGLCYHFGLFRQIFKDNQQACIPDRWLGENSPLVKTDLVYNVNMGGKNLTARMYDLDIIGERVNKLHLFDLEGVDENIVGEGINFNKGDIEKNLTLFLYPDDSDDAGRLLRIYQEYFMVACGAKFIIEDCVNRGCKLWDLNEYAVIQINDTHPTMIIPELIRILTEKGLDFDSAVSTVEKTCAYTNHTILAEALEKWHIDSLKKAVPQLVQIMEVLDDRVRRRFENPKVHIIDSEGFVRMAGMDIHYSFSVNGVAALHTDILKNTELKDFYEIYPEKFNNKTNGITFRRWLFHANAQLAEFIGSLIGEDFKKDPTKLKELMKFKNDKKVLDKLIEIKQCRKKILSHWLYKKQGILIDENSIFDIQIKRIHEYKRQQLNALYVINKFLEIKRGKLPKTPITVIFGGKAAPAYTIAQDIIHLILCLSEIISLDTAAKKYLRVVMVENYNVSCAEMLIPACDISQQISLASKEASGTGNMKFMLNGGITLGTEDGANVEIHSLVGDENIYIFGDSSEKVVKRYSDGNYNPREYYERQQKLKNAVDFITSPKLLEIGDKQRLERLKNELLNKDWFMTFPDFEDYCAVRDKAYEDYNDREKWAEKMLVNIANAGYFSSDRTILEYNRDIWKLEG